MAKKRLRLKLSPAQKSAIKKDLLLDVNELVLSVEEFGVKGTRGGKMKVLKVENVATVTVAGVSGVVN